MSMIFLIQRKKNCLKINIHIFDLENFVGQCY